MISVTVRAFGMRSVAPTVILYIINDALRLKLRCTRYPFQMWNLLHNLCAFNSNGTANRYPYSS